MTIRSLRRNVPGKWCFSAALATSFGKKVNPAGTSCASVKFAWIVTRTRCLCAWKRWGPAFATRDTGVASFAPSNREAKQNLSRNELFRRKQSTDRRSAHEPAEAGNPKRQSARRDARPVFSRGLENYAELAKLRAND